MREEQDGFRKKELETAITEEQLTFYLQPRLMLPFEKVCGAEALVRWVHPVKGVLLPEDFLFAFEKNDLAVSLDRYVCEKVCEMLHAWVKDGKEMNPVSVNLSEESVFHTELVPYLKSLLKKYELDSKLLQLEITEEIYLKKPDHVKKVIKALHDAGFFVILDDFGSGYSSLNTLKGNAIDALKLDMKYLPIRKKSEHDEIILVSIIKMANWMGMTVIAEKVENRRQKVFLEGTGCDCMQGNYYCSPIAREAYEKKYVYHNKEQYSEEKEEKTRYNVTLLIIDDDAMSRDILKEIFKDLYHIALCENAEEGLAYLKQNAGKVKLILTDHYMPGMNGMEFLKYCKQNAAYRSIPQIMITVNDEDDSQVEAFKMGAYDYITKPFAREIVLARVNHVMELSCRTSIFDMIEQKYLQKPELDAATELLNKTAFNNLATQILDVYPNERQALLIIDIDDFKQVNDRYGHLMGDKVIRYVAEEISRIFRKTDIIGRFGGDEFMVFMTRLKEPEIVRTKAEELIKAVLLGCMKQFNIGISVSVGLAFSEEEDLLDHMFAQADHALYDAKKTGKGKAVVFGEKVLSIKEDNKPVILVYTKSRQVCQTITLAYGNTVGFAQVSGFEELKNAFQVYGNRIKIICMDCVEKTKEVYNFAVTMGAGSNFMMIGIGREGDMNHLKKVLQFDIHDVIKLPPQAGDVERIITRTLLELSYRNENQPKIN